MKKQLLLIATVLALTACANSTSNSANNSNSNTDNSGNSVPPISYSVEESVSGPKGTLTNPYTIAEAIAIIGKNTSYSTETIYIKGIVSEKPYFNQKYSSYSAYLVDQGGTESVQVYSGTIDANAGQNDIQQGDTVIAGGHYTYYEKNGQPELAGSGSVSYPVYYKIIRSGVVIEETYESLEDNDKETVTTKIDFTAANAETMSGPSANNPEHITWTSGIVTMEYDPGTQYSFQQYTDPFRFYVGTYLHIRVSTGKIKYVQFDTDQNYPFTADEPVTNGKTQVESETKTYVLAKTNTNYIKIHNSNKGQVKDVLIKQKRFYSMTVVSYK